MACKSNIGRGSRPQLVACHLLHSAGRHTLCDTLARVSLGPTSYVTAIIGGKSVKIVDSNKDRVLEWFAEWAAEQQDGLGASRLVLVPIPSSSTLASSPATFRTALMAMEIAKRLRRRSVVRPVLRFKAQMISSRAGGPRDPQCDL
jgi:hypothetical protein